MVNSVTNTFGHRTCPATDVTNLPPFVDGRRSRRTAIHLPSVVSSNDRVIPVKCAVDGAAGTPGTDRSGATAALHPRLPSVALTSCSSQPDDQLEALNYFQ